MSSRRPSSSNRRRRVCARRTFPSASFRYPVGTAWTTTPCVRWPACPPTTTRLAPCDVRASGPLELVEVAPVFLRRASFAGHDHRRGVFELPVKPLACRPGFGRLFVQQRGLRGGAASIAQG